VIGGASAPRRVWRAPRAAGWNDAA
jgi:hypothetical protein